MSKKQDHDGLKNKGITSKTKGELAFLQITKKGVIRCVNISKKWKGKFVY